MKSLFIACLFPAQNDDYESPLDENSQNKAMRIKAKILLIFILRS